MIEIENVSKSSTENRSEEVLKNKKNMEQVSIQYEKICKDTEIIEPLVTKHYESTPKESNYNILIHETYETDNLTLPKTEDIASGNIENQEEVSSKYEYRPEVIYVKNEMTEELIIKDESDFIQIETKENTESEQFSDSNLYYLTENESTAGLCAVNKNEMGENIEKMYSFKIEKELEDICIKKDITDELIIKDEPDFIQIETQENTNSKEVPPLLYFSTKSESIAGPNKNSILDFQRKLVPTGTKPYESDDSVKKIFQKSVLKQHERIHINENPYACDFCKMTFIDKSSLVKHKIINTCERLYPCNICKKTFRRRTDCERHERIHTGEKPYACDVCEKTFSDKCNLITHKIIHTGERPYACNICEKKFRRKGAFQRHERIHTGEKPYACDVCDKSFSDKSTLIRHKVMHTGEKPYACNICKKTFSQKCNLNQHLKSLTHVKSVRKHSMPKGI